MMAFNDGLAYNQGMADWMVDKKNRTSPQSSRYHTTTIGEQDMANKMGYNPNTGNDAGLFNTSSKPTTLVGGRKFGIGTPSLGSGIKTTSLEDEFYKRNPNAVMTSEGWEGVTDKADLDSMKMGDGKGWWNENAAGIGAAAQGLGAIAGLGNLYLGYKNYQLGKDKFGVEKALANANYTNQAKAYNEELGRSADVGLALAGNSMTPEQKAAYQQKIQGQKVSESLGV